LLVPKFGTREIHLFCFEILGCYIISQVQDTKKGEIC
jgi:hypothetical protein